MVRAFTNLGEGGLVEFDAEFKFAKIQNSHVEGGGGLVEFDAEFKFAKIQNSHVGGEGGLVEFDAELKFAKIQNSHVEGWGWRGGALWNLMLSSNLLKSKNLMLRGGGLMEFDAEFKFAQIPNSHVKEGGLVEFDAKFKFAKFQNSHVGGGALMEFDAESKFVFKKIFFVKNFLSFRTKIGKVLFWTLSTKWFPYTKYRRTTNRTEMISQASTMKCLCV